MATYDSYSMEITPEAAKPDPSWPQPLLAYLFEYAQELRTNSVLTGSEVDRLAWELGNRLRRIGIVPDGTNWPSAGQTAQDYLQENLHLSNATKKYSVGFWLEAIGTYGALLMVVHVIIKNLRGEWPATWQISIAATGLNLLAFGGIVMATGAYMLWKNGRRLAAQVLAAVGALSYATAFVLDSRGTGATLFTVSSWIGIALVIALFALVGWIGSRVQARQRNRNADQHPVKSAQEWLSRFAGVLRARYAYRREEASELARQIQGDFGLGANDSAQTLESEFGSPYLAAATFAAENGQARKRLAAREKWGNLFANLFWTVMALGAIVLLGHEIWRGDNVGGNLLYLLIIAVPLLGISGTALVLQWREHRQNRSKV